VAAQKIPIVFASNFSIGGERAFFADRPRRQKILGDNFDLEILETHHRLKKDAPSGTAKTLAENFANGPANAEKLRHGRERNDWRGVRNRRLAFIPFAAAMWWAIIL